MLPEEQEYNLNLKLCLFSMLMFLFLFFNFEFYKVKGNSMYPNVQDQEYILVNKAATTLFPLYHGEIVVIKIPNDSNYYIKRIIGLPNETVKMVNDSLYIDGEKQEEPYIYKDLINKTEFFSNFSERKVPLGKLFVMGDNRYNSMDSRNGLGYIDETSIVGVFSFNFCFF
ncbi:signal peptidase I [Bacillus sp. MB353a]|uniref:signal peptidase I n=1 Tax=Bacillus sp. MB353a TaxID=1982041 RepID=UPI000B533ADC|nr:signal peptidase I [Bacillus sp. MB353a]OWW10196.1 signal peptidase I [Bacillus sp. MB353a]